MSRKIFLIPPFLLLLGAFLSSTEQASRMDFWLWLFAFSLSCLIFIPIAFSFDDKKVPVFQIFFLIIIFLIFFGRLAFWDFLALNLGVSTALIYGVLTSFGLLAAIMLIRGQEDW